MEAHETKEIFDNPLRDKTCLVCGDKALGYNFNAVTCESCKAFFRRNALKDKEFKCPFNRKCEINAVTRKFCQYCRLCKCFDVGMKKEYIMSEDEKEAKRRKIQQRRARRVCQGADNGQETWAKRARSDFIEEKPQPTLFCVVSCESPTSSISGFHPSAQNIRSKDGYSSTIARPHEMEDEFRIKPALSYKSPCKVDLQKPAPFGCSLDLRQPSSQKSECDRDYKNVDPVLSSPHMLEPSSPVGSAVSTARSSRISFETNTSRPVEIYQIAKSFHRKKKSLTTSDRSDCASERSLLDDNEASDSDEKMNFVAVESNPNPLLHSLVGDRTSSEAPRAFRQEIAEEVFRDIPNLDSGHSIDSILTEAIKLEYEAYSSMNPKINSRELNDGERAKLNELIVANKALLAPLEDDVTSGMAQAMSKVQNNLGSKPMLVDVLNLTAVAIRRLIKMSKKVNAFKNMCQEDQVALLKGGCTEMMILRSAMTYDSDRGSWKIPHSAERPMNIKVDVLKEAGGRVFEEHERFLQTFDPRWRNDENIMLILSAITLFTPDRPRVVHYDVIKLEQNSYYYLLRRYLESIYPGCEARSTFLKLIQKIAELHRLNEDHVRVYMELNPEDVEPLLIEIFDLNIH